jgi:hypothetical protein
MRGRVRLLATDADQAAPYSSRRPSCPQRVPPVCLQYTPDGPVAVPEAGTLRDGYHTPSERQTPGEQDLQDCMQVCQGGIAVHQHPTPDERTDTTQDDAELVDAEQCSSGSHVLRVAHRTAQGLSRYLALSRPASKWTHHAVSGLGLRQTRGAGQGGTAADQGQCLVA